MADRYSQRLSDLSWTAKAVLVAPTDDTYNLIRIPAKSLVKKIWVWITTGATAASTATVTIGHTGGGVAADPDGFIDATLGTLVTAGMLASTQDAQPASEGIYFEKGAVITATTLIGTATDQANFEVYVEYVQIT